MTANGMFEPSRPASSSWTPSCLAALSDISTMIASTRTCSRLVSSWRITSPNWRWTSAGAAMTRALAPSNRVTTAPRGPKMPGPAGSAEAGGRARSVTSVCAPALPPTRLAMPAWSLLSRDRPVLDGRRRHRLAEQLLQYGQKLGGVGMFEEHDPDLGAARRPGVELGRHRRQPRHRGRIAAQRQRVRAVDRNDGDAAILARQGIERGGDLAGAGILKADDAARGGVAVDRGEQPADAGDIVGEVGDHHRAAAPGDRPLLADQRLERLDRGGRIDMAQPEDLGDEGVGAAP